MKRQKPESIKEQISMMWDVIFNELPHRLKWQDIKINFILAFLALLLVIIGIILAKQIGG